MAASDAGSVRLRRDVKGVFAGRYARYLLPGVLFQSTLMGGGYASGRETVEYGGRLGPMGLVTIAVIFVGFGLVCALAFEFARVTRAYDYHTFIRGLIGRAWPLFDLLFVGMAVLFIAVVTAATGEVAEQTFEVPYLLAVSLVIVAVAAIILGGGRVIERFKTVGTVLLYAVFLFFGLLVLGQLWPQVEQTFAAGSPPEATVGRALLSGVEYVSYNLAILPAVFFALYRQTRRHESLTSGVIAGLVASLPFAITFICLMAFYPSEEVLGARVPWLVMLGAVAGPLVAAGYTIIVLWTLVETATGMVHAITDRVDVGLEAAGRRKLTPLQSALLTVAILAAAVGMAQFGIIALVAQGYSLMAYGFILLFAIPLLTVGLYRIVRAPPTSTSDPNAEADRPAPVPLGAP